MRFLNCLATMTVLTWGTMTFAQDDSLINNDANVETSAQPAETAADELVHGWYFLSCVHSSHQCSDEAHESGYHHHKTGNDHRCDHHHFGCFVQ